MLFDDVLTRICAHSKLLKQTSPNILFTNSILQPFEKRTVSKCRYASDKKQQKADDKIKDPVKLFATLFFGLYSHRIWKCIWVGDCRPLSPLNTIDIPSTVRYGTLSTLSVCVWMKLGKLLAFSSVAGDDSKKKMATNSLQFVFSPIKWTKWIKMIFGRHFPARREFSEFSTSPAIHVMDGIQVGFFRFDFIVFLFMLR